jgi:hypothetical protein
MSRTSVRTLLSLAAAVFLATCARAGDERGAFIVTLGRDTTSVERYVRSRDRLEVEMIGRSPRLLRRTFRYDYERGRLRRFEMTVVPPGSEVPTQQVNAAVDGDSLRLETRSGGRPAVSSAVGFPAGSMFFASTSPWAVYETELLRLLGSHRDSLGGTLLMLGADHPERWTMRRAGRDSVLVWNSHGDLFRAHVDSRGRLLATTALGGTFRVEIVRRPWLDLDAFAIAFEAREQAGAGLGTLSPRDTVRATIGGATLTFDYGRPSKRGRVLFGSLVPFGEVWRTGANAATVLTTDHALEFGGTQVPAGAYSVWTVPGPEHWTLILNSETGQWGTQHRADQDVFSFEMKVSALPVAVERFTASLEPTGEGAELRLDWDTTRAAVDFRVPPE